MIVFLSLMTYSQIHFFLDSFCDFVATLEPSLAPCKCVFYDRLKAHWKIAHKYIHVFTVEHIYFMTKNMHKHCNRVFPSTVNSKWHCFPEDNVFAKQKVR